MPALLREIGLRIQKSAPPAGNQTALWWMDLVVVVFRNYINRSEEVLIMGILFTSVKLQQKMQQNMVLERLIELGVEKSQTGKDIRDCDYGEMKYELVIAEMRQVDIDHPDHKWFR